MNWKAFALLAWIRDQRQTLLAIVVSAALAAVIVLLWALLHNIAFDWRGFEVARLGLLGRAIDWVAGLVALFGIGVIALSGIKSIAASFGKDGAKVDIDTGTNGDGQ